MKLFRKWKIRENDNKYGQMKSILNHKIKNVCEFMLLANSVRGIHGIVPP